MNDYSFSADVLQGGANYRVEEYTSIIFIIYNLYSIYDIYNTYNL